MRLLPFAVQLLSPCVHVSCTTCCPTTVPSCASFLSVQLLSSCMHVHWATCYATAVPFCPFLPKQTVKSVCACSLHHLTCPRVHASCAHPAQLSTPRELASCAISCPTVDPFCACVLCHLLQLLTIRQRGHSTCCCSTVLPPMHYNHSCLCVRSWTVRRGVFEQADLRPLSIFV